MRRTALIAAGLLGVVLCVPFIIGPPLAGRMRIAWLAIVVMHVAWCLVESEAAACHRPKTSRMTGALPLAIGITTLVLMLAATVDAIRGALLESALPARLGIGLAIAGAGVTLRHAAIKRLGPRFRDSITIAPHDHALETDGVFGRCRHPAELGFLLVMLATVIVSGSVLPAIVLVPLTGLVAWRMALEDDLLRAHFGNDATRYQRDVPAFGWRLTPRRLGPV